MGIGLAFRGYAITIGAISRLCIWVNGIAIDRSGRHSIGAGRFAIEFTVACVGEMVPAAHEVILHVPLWQMPDLAWFAVLQLMHCEPQCSF